MTAMKTKAHALPLPLRERVGGRGRGDRSCIGDRVCIRPEGPAPRRTSASKPDTEFHGVRYGVTRSRSFWRFAQNYWHRAVVFFAKVVLR